MTQPNSFEKEIKAAKETLAFFKGSPSWTPTLGVNVNACLLEHLLATRPAAAKAPADEACPHDCANGWIEMAFSKGGKAICVHEPCPIHAPKPEATTELCAVCGSPASAWWHDEDDHHKFRPKSTPAPKEQRP